MDFLFFKSVQLNFTIGQNKKKKIKQTSGEEIVIKKALVCNLKKHQNMAKEVELTT